MKLDFLNVGNNNDVATTELIDDITYVIITNKLATYKELRDDYDTDEYLKLYDIAVTQISNKAKALDKVKDKNGR